MAHFSENPFYDERGSQLVHAQHALNVVKTDQFIDLSTLSSGIDVRDKTFQSGITKTIKGLESDLLDAREYNALQTAMLEGQQEHQITDNLTFQYETTPFYAEAMSERLQHFEEIIELYGERVQSGQTINALNTSSEPSTLRKGSFVPTEDSHTYRLVWETEVSVTPQVLDFIRGRVISLRQELGIDTEDHTIPDGNQ